LRKHHRKNTFGLYKRKLVFFSLVFVVMLFGISIYQESRYKADSIQTIGNYQQNFQTKNLDLKKNGDLILDSESTKGVDVLSDFDEIRLPFVSKPGQYIDQLEVVLNLDSDYADKIKAEVIAEHGVGDSSFYVSAPNQLTYHISSIAPTGDVTIVAKVPKGILEPSINKVLIHYLSQIKISFWLLLAIIIPTITSVFMVLVLAFEYRRQRIDIPTKEIDAPPMAIPPGVVGALYKQKVASREIAATLIDLAKRGDIFIVDKERGFSFGKGKFDQRLLGFEKILLSKIFTSSIKSSQKQIEERINKHLYSKKMSLLTVGIYALATRLGYFKANPYKMHIKYRLIGVGLFLVGFACFILSLYIFKDPPYAVFFWLGEMIAALIISISASNMPIRSPIGQEVMSNWLAFKKYLSNPNKLPYSENNPDLFQRYLPYAIVLECEAAWARRFTDHSFMVPDWFITDKTGLSLDDFCLSLYPIVSYVGKSLAAIREPGFH